MAEDFATALASKLTGHPSFWNDLEQLQIGGVRASLLGMQSSIEPGLEAVQLGRLLYSASILSQTASESNRSLAQTIALSALLANPEERLRERSKNILAGLGNFPAVSYISEKYPSE